MTENENKIEVGKIFTVLDENDQEQEMKVLGLLTVEETVYAAVCFIVDIQEESDKDIDIFFLQAKNEEELSMIESEDEFEKVSAAFHKLEKSIRSKKRGKKR